MKGLPKNAIIAESFKNDSESEDNFKRGYMYVCVILLSIMSLLVFE